ncbi:unnamed protein product [Owenia fusiformis]|uniref:Uncharacterized protein n=1 Tax=Owenia fusiformis TaxID=6347 RepID=A0A8S4QA13_OWEFU|nr:unnamed protein product [Owenia fusiformis]
MSEVLPLGFIANIATVQSLLDHLESNDAPRIIQMLRTDLFTPVSEGVLLRLVHDYPSQVTNKLLVALVPPHIRELVLRKCLNISASGLENVLRKCPHLNKLDLTGCDHLILPRCFKMAGILAPQLTSLSVEGCPAVSNHIVKVILKCNRNLRHLNLSCCDNITDDVFLLDKTTQLLRSYKHWNGDDFPCKLTSVDISQCDNITSLAIRHLTTLCGPHLQHVDMAWTSVDCTALWYLAGYSLDSAAKLVSVAEKHKDVNINSVESLSELLEKVEQPNPKVNVSRTQNLEQHVDALSTDAGVSDKTSYDDSADHGLAMGYDEMDNAINDAGNPIGIDTESIELAGNVNETNTASAHCETKALDLEASHRDNNLEECTTEPSHTENTETFVKDISTDGTSKSIDLNDIVFDCNEKENAVRHNSSLDAQKESITFSSDNKDSMENNPNNGSDTTSDCSPNDTSQDQDITDNCVHRYVSNILKTAVESLVTKHRTDEGLNEKSGNGNGNSESTKAFDVQDKTAQAKYAQTELTSSFSKLCDTDDACNDSNDEISETKDTECEFKDTVGVSNDTKSDLKDDACNDSNDEISDTKDTECEFKDTVGVSNDTESDLKDVACNDSNDEISDTKDAVGDSNDDIGDSKDTKSDIVGGNLDAMTSDSKETVIDSNDPTLDLTDIDSKLLKNNITKVQQLYKPCLKSVNLCHIEFSDRNMLLISICIKTFIRENRDIESLYISWSGLHDNMLQYLTNHTEHLKFLDLSECTGLYDGIASQGIASLGTRCPNIQHLILRGINFINDVVLLPLLPKLRLSTLSLSETDVTDRTLFLLARYQSKILTNLDLSWCEELTETGLNEIVTKCTYLEVLSLRKLPASKVTLFKMAKHCRYLSSLNLSGLRGIDDTAIVSLVSRLPQLEKVDISWNSGVTDASINVLFSRCSKLEECILSGIKLITSKPLLHIIANYNKWFRCKKLLQLKLQERKILGEDEHYSSDEEFEDLFYPHRSTTYVPNLKKLQLEYCDKINDIHLAEIVAVCRGSLEIIDYYSEKVKPKWLTPLHLKLLPG